MPLLKSISSSSTKISGERNLILCPQNFGDPQIVENVYQFYLDRCNQSSSLVDSLISIYNHSNSNNEIWGKSKPVFEQQLNYAVGDLIDVLYTAWDLSGRPNNFPEPPGGGCYNFNLYSNNYKR